jgi:hypothetical protein
MTKPSGLVFLFIDIGKYFRYDFLEVIAMLHSFERNSEYTVPSKPLPLVAENSFLTKQPDAESLPVFEEARELLPVPEWVGHEDYLDAYWTAWKLAFGNLRKPEPGSGFVSDFIDTAFNNCLFMWDSAFILMFGKYGSRAFDFQQTLDNLYSHQHRDGYICREIDTFDGTDQFTRFDPSSTGPEVLPWSEWEYYLNTGDADRLAKVFPPLMAYHRWMREWHTWPDGSYFSSGLGCGMDNIPRTQPGYHKKFSNGHMVWVDACLQALFSCDLLIRMATVLGRDEFIPELETEKQNLESIINHRLWDEKTGFYYDQWKNGEKNMVRHAGAFWAMISGCASSDQAERLVEHLNDENGFKTPNRVPALAKDDPNFSAVGSYWKGGVWAPVNYMVLRGLDRYGYYRLGHEIASDYLKAILGVFKETGTFFENYAPEYVDGKPIPGDPAKADFVGWTGLGPITILFEYIFGIKPDAHNRTILWDVRLLEKHGIDRYPFGREGQLRLLCAERKDENEEPQITLESNVPVTLEVVWGAEGQKQRKYVTSKGRTVTK